jgi:N-acetyl sugar amidotransferase
MSLDSTYVQCKRCVMDTTDPDITFDSDGNCNHCSSFIYHISQEKKITSLQKKNLDAVLTNIKTSGGKQPFDCIVGISGGVDSCYTAYLCKELGLKPLLLHLDNGWDSEIAVRNIHQLAQQLNLPYTSYVLDWEEFKQLQLAFLKSSIVDLEIPTDLAIPGALYEIAAKHKIKYIISGGNYTSEGILPIKWGYHVKKDLKLYRSIIKKHGTIRRKKTPAAGYLSEIYYKFFKGIKTIYLLNYIDYNKDEAKKLLMERFDWRDYGGKHHESRFTAFWQGYLLPEKFGIDYRKATLSTQICFGQKSRDEALNELTQSPFDIEKIAADKKYLCKKLQISEEELAHIIAQKPKYYTDFPNEEKRIDFIYSMYRKLYPNKRI